MTVCSYQGYYRKVKLKVLARVWTPMADSIFSNINYNAIIISGVKEMI